MAINDLIRNKFFRVAGTLAALTISGVVGCGGDGKVYDCETFCKWIMDECLLPEYEDYYQSEVKKCVGECQDDASTYDADVCFSCAKSYKGTQKERCNAFHECMRNNCGDFS